MAGHIKLDRKIIDWEWYSDANTCRLFIHLLLIANYKDSKWRGQLIQRGQVITGLLKLNEDTGLSVSQLRTSFDKLKMTGEITIRVTNKFRIVTICKYDDYQSFKDDNDKQNSNQNNSQVASQSQANDKQIATSNKNKEVNNNKNIVVESSAAPAATPIIDFREEKFKKSLVPFVESYGKEMIRAFFDYWREPNKSKTRMRWEMEKTWDLNLRLKKWQSNQDKFEKGKPAIPTITQPKPIPGITQSTGSAPLPILNGIK